jgi:hypothetical protein
MRPIVLSAMVLLWLCSCGSNVPRTNEEASRDRHVQTDEPILLEVVPAKDGFLLTVLNKSLDIEALCLLTIEGGSWDGAGHFIAHTRCSVGFGGPVGLGSVILDSAGSGPYVLKNLPFGPIWIPSQLSAEFLISSQDLDKYLFGQAAFRIELVTSPVDTLGRMGESVSHYSEGISFSKNIENPSSP